MSASKSWPPSSANALSWSQLAVLLSLVGLIAGAAYYVPSAIAKEGSAARAAARELVMRERADARREFATSADVRVLQTQLQAVRDQLGEALAILREMDSRGQRGGRRR